MAGLTLWILPVTFNGLAEATHHTTMKIKNTSGKTMGFTLGNRTHHLAPNATALVDESNPKAIVDVNTYVVRGYVSIVEGNAQAMVPGDVKASAATYKVIDLGAYTTYDKTASTGLVTSGKLLTLANTVLEFTTGSVTAGNFAVVTADSNVTTVNNLKAALASADVTASLAADGLRYVGIDVAGADVILTLSVSDSSTVVDADFTTDVDSGGAPFAVTAVSTAPAAVATISKKVTVADFPAASAISVLFPFQTVLAVVAYHVATATGLSTPITAAATATSDTAPESVRLTHSGALGAGDIYVVATCAV